VQVGGSDRSYVLQLDTRGMEHEYRVLKAVEPLPVPAPRPYGLDLQGEALGVPCFFSDFIEGGSLLGPILAGEAWAEKLYLEAVCSLMAVTEEDLGEVAGSLDHANAEVVLEHAYASLRERSLPLAEAAYRKLKSELPVLPPLRFNNGDLWLDNFILRDGKLAGIIDFQHACFSDPVFEFLLSFFVSPELQGRGIEKRFCRCMEVDPAVLHWYHGLEYFDLWPWLLRTGQSFVHHTQESVAANLQAWLEGKG
jgi:aminoglycoside phosphotransferase (APT) family kinase protein